MDFLLDVFNAVVVRPEQVVGWFHR
jgi:hypothetical protein